MGKFYPGIYDGIFLGSYLKSLRLRKIVKSTNVKVVENFKVQEKKYLIMMMTMNLAQVRDEIIRI